MNGIHDMGGLHGFGRVEVEANEPVFHARWEARVFGMVQSLPGGNIDAGRHSLERLDPVAYLRNGYYGRWLAAMERSLIAFGVVTEDDIRARMRGRRRRSKAIRPVRNESSTAWQREPVASYARQVDRPPLFRGGQAVRTRNHQPAGHTRLPAYARCRRGTIVSVHPAMVYPDDHAHGRGENPQYLYTVRFDGRELWGGSAEPATVVHLDLFEPYLEPA
jgi:nitrile hydratase beta subunit